MDNSKIIDFIHKTQPDSVIKNLLQLSIQNESFTHEVISKLYQQTQVNSQLILLFQGKLQSYQNIKQKFEDCQQDFSEHEESH